MLLKVKSNGAVELPIYDFLLMSNSNHMPTSHRLAVAATPISYHRPKYWIWFNSNIMTKLAALQDRRLQNLGDLEFDLSNH